MTMAHEDDVNFAPEEIPVYLLEEEQVDEWNQWRSEHQEKALDLVDIDLSFRNLRGANLREADLSSTNLQNAYLYGADLYDANLTDADLTDTNFSISDVQNTKGLAPIYLCQVIELDSISDEEAIRLYKEITEYLVDIGFAVKGEAISFSLVDYLIPLWMRLNEQNKLYSVYSDVEFGNDYGIEYAVPYAYLASYPNYCESAGSYEFFSRILDRTYQEQRYYFLEKVILILVERLCGDFYDLEIIGYNIECQLAYLVNILIEDYLSSRKFPTNFDIDGFLYDLCHCIVELDSSILEEYHHVSPSVLSGLLNCYRDVFGHEKFQGFLDDEQFPNIWEENLIGVNFSNINLSGVDLSNANLSGADLSGADLTDADLTDANLEDIITDENTKIELPE